MGRWITPAGLLDFCEQQQSLWGAVDISVIFFTEKLDSFRVLWQEQQRHERSAAAGKAPRVLHDQFKLLFRVVTIYPVKQYAQDLLEQA